MTAMNHSGIFPPPNSVLFSGAAVLIPHGTLAAKRRAPDHEEQLVSKRYKPDLLCTSIAVGSAGPSNYALGGYGAHPIISAANIEEEPQ